MAYPNILARGQGFVVTNNHSGGLSFPRHPVGAIRQKANGGGVRSNRYGFERDCVGGNRIPACGLERRVILGRTVEIPMELVVGKVTKAGLAAVRANKPAKVLNHRPGAVAKAAAKDRRESIVACAKQARAFNAALKAAKAAYEAGLAKRMASMIAVERVALQQAVNSLVATFNGSGEGLVGGL